MIQKIIGIAAGVLLIGILVFIVFSNNATAPNPEPGNGGDPETTFPIGTGTSSTGTDDEKRIALTTQSGEIIRVRNFLEAPATVPDTSNLGYYFLGNTFSTTPESGVSSPAYVISYIAETQYFNITLLTEPLARARISAEGYLMTYLGISAEEMCKLSYMVSTPHYVNEYYTGSSLGFSFCSGSIPLE